MLAGLDPLTLLGVLSAAFAGSILGGLAGYGTMLVLPALLAPLVGATQVVPILAIAAILMNASRLFVFWHEISWPMARRVLLGVLAGTALGAVFFSGLSARWASVFIGTVMALMLLVRSRVPQLMARASGERVGLWAFGYGCVSGGASGVGVFMIALLSATGLAATPVVATDAVVSLAGNVVKVITFGLAGAVSWRGLLLGLLIGLATVPGAFVARALARRLATRVHETILNVLVVLGSAYLITQGLLG